MFSFYEFNMLVLDAIELIGEYKDKYEELVSKHNLYTPNISVIKTTTSRTIHNIENNIRPDFMKFDSSMNFFDFSPFWRNKKKRNYKIVTDECGEVKFIIVGQQYIEFHIHIDDRVVLIDYSKPTISSRYTLESVGLGIYESNKIKVFLVAEVKSNYVMQRPFDLKCEEYEYNNSTISKIITYEYTSQKSITKDAANPDLLGSIKHDSGLITANPHIYIDNLIYSSNGNVCKIIRSDYYNTNIGNTIINIK